MFCTECGKENLQTSKFCQKCGSSIAQAALLPPTLPKPGVVCPKCGKAMVLSQPDGSPLLDNYVHMECKSCGNNERYKIIRDEHVNVVDVQKPSVPKKRFVSVPMFLLIIIIVVSIANEVGWISLPQISIPGGGTGGGSIVGSWVAGDTTLTFNPNGTYSETLRGNIFDTGKYSISGGKMTMTSNFKGATTTASYSISGNTLNGFIDANGRHVTYTR